MFLRSVSPQKQKQKQKVIQQIGDRYSAGRLALLVVVFRQRKVIIIDAEREREREVALYQQIFCIDRTTLSEKNDEESVLSLLVDRIWSGLVRRRDRSSLRRTGGMLVAIRKV